MRLTSTVPAYLALAAVEDDVRRAEAWTEQYEAAHPEVFATYHRSWGRHERCLAAAADVPRLAPTLPAVEARAHGLVEQVEGAFHADGLIDDDLDVVLMVGAHTSNGWVTEVGGRETLFLALEFLGEPPYDQVLVSHEAVHVAHLRNGAGGWPEDGAAGLFQEGLAVAVSRMLHPGLTDSAYLWHDGAHDDWVEECAALAPQLAARTLGVLDAPEEDPTVRALFTGTRPQPGLPVRAGYWLGDVVLRDLLAETPSEELVAWDHATARLAVADRLGELI
jgi:hypothetical protein